jgi:hypothetical protein
MVPGIAALAAFDRQGGKPTDESAAELCPHMSEAAFHLGTQTGSSVEPQICNEFDCRLCASANTPVRNYGISNLRISFFTLDERS